MTEADWITTKMPLYMLRDYPRVWDERKAYLAGSYCVRRAWSRLTEVQKRYIEAAEREREGTGSAEETAGLLGEFRQEDSVRVPQSLSARHAYFVVASFSRLPAAPALIDLFRYVYLSADPAEESAEKAWQCALLRELFGNPFRLINFAPWRTDTALSLARQMYDANEFGAMPILADALQDAGCEDVNVLDHCREPGAHVRGCWVIDALLETV